MQVMFVSSQQIAIAGRVLEGETEKAISGAMVEIIDMPESFRAILSLKALQYGSQWEKMSDRPDRKFTASDGYFYFVDLPPGTYKLKASVPDSTIHYENAEKKEKEVIVAEPVNIDNDVIPKKIVKQVIPTTFKDTDIILVKATGIKGTIADADEPNNAVVNAKVQIQGSQHSTFSDRNGNYLLVGLEASKSESEPSTVIVSATGYKQISQPVLIKQREVITNHFYLTKTISR